MQVGDKVLEVSSRCKIKQFYYSPSLNYENIINIYVCDKAVSDPDQRRFLRSRDCLIRLNCFANHISNMIFTSAGSGV
jgi:hypothetical protein